MRNGLFGPIGFQAYRMYVGLEPERFVAHSRPGF